MKFVAFERSKQGTGASRRLRNAGSVMIVAGLLPPPAPRDARHAMRARP